MIQIEDRDIGRRVEYTPAHGPSEIGEVTSFNDQWVFVKYGVGNITSKATRREDLKWSDVQWYSNECPTATGDTP